jgi:hypothetical protein
MLPLTTASYSGSHKLYRGTVPLTLENRFAAFIGQWKILQRTAYTRPITPCGCQNRLTELADLQRTQAGRTLVWRG